MSPPWKRKTRQGGMSLPWEPKHMQGPFRHPGKRKNRQGVISPPWEPKKHGCIIFPVPFQPAVILARDAMPSLYLTGCRPCAGCHAFSVSRRASSSRGVPCLLCTSPGVIFAQVYPEAVSTRPPSGEKAAEGTAGFRAPQLRRAVLRGGERQAAARIESRRDDIILVPFLRSEALARLLAPQLRRAISRGCERELAVRCRDPRT